MHQYLEEQAAKTPDAVAAVFRNESLTYRELNAKANQLAHHLRQQGVRPESVVGLMLDRSLWMIIGIYGILKAGGAYLPLAPSNPVQRLQYIQEDSGVQVVLTESKHLGKLTAQMIALDDEDLYTGSEEDLLCVNQPSDLVYVIYTSGSTGKPKGVMIEHGALVNRLEWMQAAYPIGSRDVILQKTPFTFDVSVWEMFWWSMVGAKVCFLAPGMEKFPQAIMEATETQQVTVMHFVPSMLNAFLNYVEGAGEMSRLQSLRLVFASGEALASQHVEKFNELLHHRNGTRLINLYGPTEATIDVSSYDCPTTGVLSGSVPIGKAITNIGLHVLNVQGDLVPDGEVGELVITGIGVARGYLNNPKLTAEKFVDSPLGRLYKTGDLARVLPDGNIEYHGRIDHQVKIRGLRIELGEIEACALDYEGVDQCAVVVREESETVVKLVACLVTETSFDLKGLRKHLKDRLPDYMLPGAYELYVTLPLTDNGKVDRKALVAREVL
ncbi:amino acid adenylation domain-containing protein [Tumebacillus sp. ITR2]|uniref:Amino acid adenylation domain-containing protein n=1 Tax=Tumebacillus amylolyticus TaxID=2801339 RepID=A0ABS1JGF0_9BACL|nr:amino acid adenylation domain-containing protein [Tumebacillus amylolyticus]MBL0388663.1 amino acid adenylation domain-containing protein [Tumebacillus amylolyticus]